MFKLYKKNLSVFFSVVFNRINIYINMKEKIEIKILWMTSLLMADPHFEKHLLEISIALKGEKKLSYVIRIPFAFEISPLKEFFMNLMNPF